MRDNSIMTAEQYLLTYDRFGLPAVRAHFEAASRRAVEELDRAEWEGW